MDKPPVLFATMPAETRFVRLGRCGGASKAGEKWPPVKLMGAASAIREVAHVMLLDAEGVMSADAFHTRATGFLGKSTLATLVFEPTPGSLKQDMVHLGALRARLPQLRVIAMGALASAAPAQLLNLHPEIDFAVQGEAEATLRDFIQASISRTPGAPGAPVPSSTVPSSTVPPSTAPPQIAGIWGRSEDGPTSGGRREMVTDLDSLPIAAHELLDPQAYRSPLIKRYPFTITEASRGCPQGCGFCNAWLMDGATQRRRSIRNLQSEMRHIAALGFRTVKFNDPTLTLNRAWAMELCQMMAQTSLLWKCNTRADCLDRELVRNMAEAGCHAIFLGVESADPGIQQYYKKTMPHRTVQKAVGLCTEYGITTVLHFIFGAPQETWETINDSIKLALDSNADFAAFNILTPYPGTELRADLKSKGLLLNHQWEGLEQSGSSIIRTRALTPRNLEHAIQRANRAFYLRPSYLLKRLLKAIRHPSDIIPQARAALALMGKRNM